jgi:hypothetical protein
MSNFSMTKIIFWILKFGYWDLFGYWDFGFGISVLRTALTLR